MYSNNSYHFPLNHIYITFFIIHIVSKQLHRIQAETRTSQILQSMSQIVSIYRLCVFKIKRVSEFSIDS